ncbi:AmmeMemoRadiSam system radical SAM enzyme [Deltaproteobacteria bacterium IMCC39524]|nr:AmmeMemoRadiSam system radical SAM enzyme [Deltaproteobacteria bacterium IMCC39524]
MHPAKFWEALDEGRVRCNLCRFHCVIAHGRRGRCGVRENHEGELFSLIYGQTVAENIDPIEKKPLYHFYPGSNSLSLATVGCNFRCLHCQNYEISQWPHERSGIPGTKTSPQDVVLRAVESGSASISYTYTEPTIFYEYAYDTAVLAKAAGVRNVFVTNGYMTTAALEAIAPYLDAANVDLKGFSNKAYKEVTGASLKGVLDCLRDYRRLGIWLEVTTLVIPGHNDSEDELKQIASFIADELGRDVPWHISAFYPTYKMLDRPATPVTALYLARDLGRRAGLKYVYLGNVNDPGASDTICPACGKTVIRRQGLRFVDTDLTGNRCNFCGYEIPGVALAGNE